MEVWTRPLATAAWSRPISSVTKDDAFSVLVQPDGKIVAVGSANDPATFYDFRAVRYLSKRHDRHDFR